VTEAANTEGKISDPATVVQGAALSSVRSAVKTDVGRERTENQDSYVIVERPTFRFYAVADGMGGARGGKTASDLATKTLSDFLADCEHLDEIVIGEAIRLSNEAIFKAAFANPALSGMGTTLVVVALTETRLYVANIGDSRAYSIRQTTVTRLTDDHTIAAELVRAGTIAPEKQNTTPISHILTRSLGAEREIQVDCWVSVNSPRRGDIYLLCSDGLHATLSERELGEVLQRPNLSLALDALIDRANERGGADNITAIAVAIDVDFPSARPTIVVDSQPLPIGTNSYTGPVKRTVSLGLFSGLMLVLGIALGSQIARFTERIDPARDLNSRANTNVLNRVDLLAGDLNVNSVLTNIDSTNRAALAQSTKGLVLPKDPGQIANLLAQTRQDLDATTRRLALWYARYDRLPNTDAANMAAEVGISVASVRTRKDAYDRANQAYLSAAENLIYNPADSAQERSVAKLMRDRDMELGELRAEVKKVVEENTQGALNRVIYLAHQRDRLQARLGQLRPTKQVPSPALSQGDLDPALAQAASGFTRGTSGGSGTSSAKPIIGATQDVE